MQPYSYISFIACSIEKYKGDHLWQGQTICGSHSLPYLVQGDHVWQQNCHRWSRGPVVAGDHLQRDRTHCYVTFTILSIIVLAEEDCLKSFRFFAICVSSSIIQWSRKVIKSTKLRLCLHIAGVVMNSNNNMKENLLCHLIYWFLHQVQI